jgi:hypothetical protein
MPPGPRARSAPSRRLALAHRAGVACAIVAALSTTQCGGRVADAGGDVDAGIPPGEPGCPAAFGRCGGDACDVDFRNDPRHCGACATDCQEGGCDLGRCTPPPQVLVQGLGQLWSFTTDDENVYVAASTGIYAVPKAGGPPTLVAADLPSVFTVARVGAHLYAFLRDSRTIVDVDLASRSTSTIVSYADAAGLVADESGLYWLPISSRVQVAALDGGSRREIGARLFDGGALALDAQSVYVAENLGGAGVSRLGKSDGAEEVLWRASSSDEVPCEVAVAGGAVVIAAATAPPIGGGPSWLSARVLAVGGGGAQLVGSVIDEPGRWAPQIATDGKIVFRSGGVGGNLVFRAELGADRWHPIASGADNVAEIAIDPSRVIWLELLSSRILVLPR